MARIKVSEGYDTIPFGQYLIQVVDIVETPNNFDPEKPQLKWLLEVIDGPHTGHQLVAYSSQAGSVKSKLIMWAQALGVQLAPGFEFDTDDLVGLQAYAKVDIQQSKPSPEFPTPRDFNKVIGLEPAYEPEPEPEPKPAPRPAVTRPGGNGGTRQPLRPAPKAVPVAAGQTGDGSDPFVNEA